GRNRFITKLRQRQGNSPGDVAPPVGFRTTAIAHPPAGIDSLFGLRRRYAAHVEIVAGSHLRQKYKSQEHCRNEQQLLRIVQLRDLTIHRFFSGYSPPDARPETSPP